MIRGAAAVALLLAVAACSDSGGGDVRSEVVATGLLNPIGMAELPDGGVLVAEEGTGEDDASAGVSLVAGGEVHRVVSGLPSGRDSGDLSGAPLVGVSPDGRVAYTAHFGAGGLLTFPVPSAKAAASGTPLGPGDLGQAMLPLNRVELINPFDIAFDPDGVPVVTDASGNGVATENADGTTSFVHRFGELPAPGNETLLIDPVPTGIARIGAEYLVTLTGGCPYPDGSGRLVAVDGERGERVVADGLDMPIDVAVGPDGTVWVVEFARFDPDASCFTGAGYLPGTGRLGRLDEDEVRPVVEDLSFPTSVLPARDGSVYVASLDGTVTRYSFGPEPEAVPDGPLRFTDVAADVGLDFRHGSFRTTVSADPVAAMGGGLCWLDFDRDGRLDLYMVNSHALAESAGLLPRNGLYRNEGGSFADVSAGSGADLVMRGMGCVAADVNADGWVDLYVTADGPNSLLINQRDGTFRDVAPEAGVTAPEWSTAAVAGDVNRDGTVDLYVGSYIDLERRIEKPSGAFPQDYLGVGDHLFLARADGTFWDAAAEAGLARADRTLGALLSDLDGDGDLDLYVANDGQPNRLFRAEPGDALVGVGFVDVTGPAGVGDSGSGMGIGGGDYDGDGAFDLFVTNWQTELNALYRQGVGLEFVYSTFRIGVAGLGNGRTGWGTAWADFDHDRDLDLFVANGRVPVTDLDADRQPLGFFANQTADGRAGQFRDWSGDVFAGVPPLLARGSAVADYDNDGDLDVAVNTIGGPAALLRNDGPAGNWLIVELEPFVAGAIVTATLADGSAIVRESRAGGSYLASEDPRLHFGLGAIDSADVEVRWPDGSVTTVAGVEAGTTRQVSPP